MIGAKKQKDIKIKQNKEKNKESKEK